MKVIIAGSRGITDYQLVKDAIKQSEFEISVVVSGVAKGVDSLGEQWAKDNNVPVMRFHADWDAYGKRAGYVRNAEMAEVADALIVIILDDSKGSLHMLKCAEDKGMKVFVKKLYTNKIPEGIDKFVV